MSIKTFLPGTVIFREGEYGDSFYQVLSGSVEVTVSYGTDHARRLTDLGPGSFFGEIAVIEKFPRTATIIACQTGATLLELSPDTMDDSFRENPDLILSLMQHLGRRTVSLSSDCLEAREALRKLKSADGSAVSPGLLERSRLFSAIFYKSGRSDKPSLETKMAAYEGKKVSDGYSNNVFACKNGTVLFKEGEPGACMYAIHWGRIGIFSGYGTDQQEKITELSTNDFFGEVGMLCGQIRSATAVALESDTTLEIIKSEDIRTLFEKNPAKVWMILDHLARRLTTLTREYAGICREIAEA